MGNKESNESIITENEDDDERHVPASPRHQPPPISPQSRKLSLAVPSNIPKEETPSQIFKQAFDKFNLISVKFNDIVPYIKEITYPSGATILEEGSLASGIHVIKNGICNVLARDNKTVIRQIEKYAFFGEVSSIYKTSVTCSVIVDSRSNCDLLFVDASKIKVSEDHSSTMEKWFLQQKYLDLAGLFPPRHYLHTMIENSLYDTHMFHDWSAQAMYELMNPISKGLVEIFQPDSCLAYEEDDDVCAYLLINGTVELVKDNEPVIAMSTKYGPLLFAEENLIFSVKKNSYSIKALTTCMVVSIHGEYFESIFEDFPTERDKLTTLKTRWESLIESQVDGLINPNIILYILKEAKLFNKTTLSFLHAVSLRAVYQSYEKNTVIAERTNNEELFAILIVAGSVAVVTPSSNIIANLSKGEIFCSESKFPANSRLVSTTQITIGKISRSLIKDLQVEFENDVEMMVSENLV